MSILRAILPLAALVVAGCTSARTAPSLPIERNAYARPSTSEEMAQTMDAIARAHSEVAAIVTLGRSALDKPMQALVLARDPASIADGRRGGFGLTVLLVGSQHGNEPSGGEALLRFAAERAAQGPSATLDGLDLIVVPNGNPDGRDLHRRVNGNGVNLSTNYASLSESESRAVAEALRRWQPDVVLDVHESAIFKPSTLARQGYLTDFEAQLGIANNSNIDPALAAFSRVLLEEMTGRINAGGLRAGEYVGEITDVAQPITRGGLSARNLRNAAGLRGAFSFLLENRLDPKFGTYPTPRNLQARIAKQLLCIEAVLNVVGSNRVEIMHLVAAARRPPAPRTVVTLVDRFESDPAHPAIDLQLRRLDGTPEIRRFEFHDRVVGEAPLPLPTAYAVVAHRAEIAALLERHGFAAATLAAPRRVAAVAQRIEARERIKPRFGFGWSRYTIVERRGTVELPAGTLWVPLDQPDAWLIPLLLDPRSTSSVFEEPPYDGWVESGRDFFLLRVE